MTTRWKCICALLVFILTTTLVAARSSAKSPGIGDISGRIVDTEGVAIKGAIVFTRFRDFKSDDPVVANIWYPTRTDEHGKFKLPLREGTYDVLVIAPGFAAEAETVPIIEGKNMKAQFKLKPLDCGSPAINCDTFK
jgi:hypothetical protein